MNFVDVVILLDVNKISIKIVRVDQIFLSPENVSKDSLMTVLVREMSDIGIDVDVC